MKTIEEIDNVILNHIHDLKHAYFGDYCCEKDDFYHAIIINKQNKLNSLLTKRNYIYQNQFIKCHRNYNNVNNIPKDIKSKLSELYILKIVISQKREKQRASTLIKWFKTACYLTNYNNVLNKISRKNILTKLLLE